MYLHAVFAFFDAVLATVTTMLITQTITNSVCSERIKR
jgi:hypothetical protein